MTKISLAQLLKAMVEQKASDLHISRGAPPQFRCQGNLVKVKMEPLTEVDTKELCYSVISDVQKVEFERNQELDFSFGIRDLCRFRGNLFYQRGSVAAVFRSIPLGIPEFETLKLPDILRKVIQKPNGLILVTGPTGSGKSTVIASLLDLINRQEYGHIITIEDPIEFVHSNKNCIVNQREVGSDTKSFSDSLRRILRQDPDYILIGELRDIETIEMALTAAETGHLVFGTLHTNGAIASINRIIGSFPSDAQVQIRQALSFTLQAVFSQQLLPRSDNKGGRVNPHELLVPNFAIRSLIREDRIHQIYSSMQSGQDESGMITMNQSLVNFVRSGDLSKQDALNFSSLPDELQKLLAISDNKTALQQPPIKRS